MNLLTPQNAFVLQDLLIVAVSGGPDSMALLHILQEKGYQQLIVAHVDHQLRPESAQEAQMLEEYCRVLGLPLEVHREDLRGLQETSGENLEALAREARYAFFDELLTTHQAKAIVTAHHADDQLETQLMNMIRGCGLEGLMGMQVFEQQRWRPLLHHSKEALLLYCQQHEIPYAVDPSNDDPRFRRNALRLQVIPLLKEMNPSLLQTFQGNQELWTSAAHYLQDQSQQALTQIEQETAWNYELGPFLELHETLQAFVLRQIYQDYYGHKKNLSSEHCEQILKILRTNVSGKQKEFGPSAIIVRERTRFFLSPLNS